MTTYIKLANGSIMTSANAERERHEAEARELAAMPFEKRMAWLAAIEQNTIRGKFAADRLRATLAQMQSGETT